MAYLFFHILSITLFSLCYKVASGERKCYTPSVQLTMYLAALIVAVAGLIISGGMIPEPKLIITGVAAGICLFTAMRTFFFAMAQGGLAVGWTFVGLSVVIPLVASIFFWNEIPSVLQISGILLMLPCVVLFGNLRLQVTGNRKRWMMLVLTASFCTGLTQVASKVISEYEYASRLCLISNYMFWIYATGAMALLVFKEGRHWSVFSAETRSGLLMAVLNVIGVYTFIKALEHLEGIVFFPTKTVCNIILTAFLAVLIWKERITHRQIAGIILGALAATLVNMG